MNEQELAQNIIRHLDQGADELDPATLARLQAAREQALSKYPATQEVYGAALSGHPSAQHHGLFSRTRLWAPLLALLLGLALIAYWQSAQQTSNNTNDIDSELLADDLPVHAYTNYILEGWIKHASQ